MAILSLTVVNRWGEVIFLVDKPPFAWDGQYRGAPCAAGAYAWRVEYSLQEGTKLTRGQKQGPLTLIR